MQYRRLIALIPFIGWGLVSIINGTGCANVIPPSGGPRDSVPPVLLEVSPPDSSANFSGNRIVFTFDEFIDLQNVQENLLVSPIPQTSPVVDFKLKTMTVRLKDSLEPNTTYTFRFGNAVKDYTEGNPVKDLTYMFTTGNYFDSLELSGNVMLAETGKVDTSLIVMLHTDGDDSAVVTKKPRYITKLDGTGRFRFRNLPAKTFYLYALKDEGGSRRYLSDKQLFAYADSAVVLPGRDEPVTLYAFSVTPPAAPVVAPSITPGGRIRRGENTADRVLKYQNSLINGEQDLLSRFTLRFEEPLRAYDSSKIRLFTDSVITPVPAYTLEKDSTGKKIVLSTGWKENTVYHLVLDKDFADDSSGKKLLKTDTIHFKTKKLSEYGSLKLRIKDLDMSRNPVLLMVSNETIFKSFPLTGPELNQPLFFPGEYQLRILFDRNKNGVWDPGNFFGEKRQPEIVRPIERKINVKPNWQNEFDIAL